MNDAIRAFLKNALLELQISAINGKKEKHIVFINQLIEFKFKKILI